MYNIISDLNNLEYTVDKYNIFTAKFNNSTNVMVNSTLYEKIDRIKIDPINNRIVCVTPDSKFTIFIEVIDIITVEFVGQVLKLTI